MEIIILFMLIYNKVSQEFTQQIIKLAKDILTNEMGINFKSKRVHFQGYSIPLSFCCFKDKKTLGFFDSKLFQIGINIYLIEQDIDVIKNILRHELAHFYLQITHKNAKQSHGPEFRDIFRKFSWSENFSKASIQISFNEEKNEKVLSKIEKLLALADSSNQHESELASRKAKELLAKYNIDPNLRESDDTYVARVLEFKRRTPLVDGIYDVMSEYFVYPIINQGPGGGYLEVIGSKTNVTIADYVAHFLTHSINNIWTIAKKNNNIKGIVAKNSFYHSFFKELRTKLENESQDIFRNEKNSRDIVIMKNNIAKDLSFRVQNVYPHLRSLQSGSRKIDHRASTLGRETAKSFSIKPALKKEQKSSGKLLSFIK